MKLLPNDHYLEALKTKQKAHPVLFEEAVLEVFEQTTSWEELISADLDTHRKILINLSRKVQLNESIIDPTKLAKSIQQARSRSYASFCVMTNFNCHFCDKEETWTNSGVPHICSDCALLMAEEIAMRYTEILKEPDSTNNTNTASEKEVKTTIEELDLSVRTYNALKRRGINSIEELRGKTDEELLSIRNFSAKSLIEVKYVLETMD